MVKIDVLDYWKDGPLSRFSEYFKRIRKADVILQGDVSHLVRFMLSGIDEVEWYAIIRLYMDSI